MDEKSFDDLLALLRPNLERDADMAARATKGGRIEPAVRLAVALRYLAGGSFLDLCDLYCCSWSTMYEIVWDAVYAINQCGALDMRFPQTQAECASAAAGFTATICKNSPLRYVVGAVDGLFIKRNAPRLSETLHVQRYFNGHKMGFGLNLQAACDHSLRFIGASCNTPGSTNDYTAWTMSDLDRLTEALPLPYILVGDAAYPPTERMITPLPGSNLDVNQDAFNYYQSQARITIERAFGMLVARWGILWRSMSCSLVHSLWVVQAVLRLHNFAINAKAAMPGRSCPIVAAAMNPVDGTLNRSPTQFATAPAPGRPRSGVSVMRNSLLSAVTQGNYRRPAHNMTRNRK
jgi:DDE superfamily endonuclease